MNSHEIERIAAAMNQARPDWPLRQLKTLLADPRMSDRPRRDVFVALAWVASEPASASPYRVLEAGPWWRAAGVEGGTSKKPDAWQPDMICTTCSQLEAVCNARTRYADDDHEFVSRAHARQRSDRPAEAVARIVGDLHERVTTDPPPRPEPEVGTEGTSRVAPIRAALSKEESA